MKLWQEESNCNWYTEEKLVCDLCGRETRIVLEIKKPDESGSGLFCWDAFCWKKIMDDWFIDYEHVEARLITYKARLHLKKTLKTNTKENEMVQLFNVSDNDKKKFIIKTDAEKEDDFIKAFSELLIETIEGMDTIGVNEGTPKHPERKKDNTFVSKHDIDMPFLMKNFIEICCKYRGYKSDVIQKTVISNKGFIPNTISPDYFINDNGEIRGDGITEEETAVADKRHVKSNG